MGKNEKPWIKKKKNTAPTHQESDEFCEHKSLKSGEMTLTSVVVWTEFYIKQTPTQSVSKFKELGLTPQQGFILHSHTWRHSCKKGRNVLCTIY